MKTTCAMQAIGLFLAAASAFADHGPGTPAAASIPTPEEADHMTSPALNFSSRQRMFVIAFIMLALNGCASTPPKRMANTDGLFDFLIGGDDVAATPIERVSSAGGEVTTAHLRAYGKNVFVSGLVGRQSPAEPPRWSHVDIIVLDARRRVIEATTANYLPRDIPHGQRGGFPQSRYTARLAALPATGSTVKVVFHGVHISECRFTDQS